MPDDNVPSPLRREDLSTRSSIGNIAATSITTPGRLVAILKDHIGPVGDLGTLYVDVVVIIVADTDGRVVHTLCANACPSSSFAAITSDVPQVISGFCSTEKVDFSVSWIAIHVSL